MGGFSEFLKYFFLSENDILVFRHWRTLKRIPLLLVESGHKSANYWGYCSPIKLLGAHVPVPPPCFGLWAYGAGSRSGEESGSISSSSPSVYYDDWRHGTAWPGWAGVLQCTICSGQFLNTVTRTTRRHHRGQLVTEPVWSVHYWPAVTTRSICPRLANWALSVRATESFSIHHLQLRICTDTTGMSVTSGRRFVGTRHATGTFGPGRFIIYLESDASHLPVRYALLATHQSSCKSL